MLTGAEVHTAFKTTRYVGAMRPITAHKASTVHAATKVGSSGNADSPTAPPALRPAANRVCHVDTGLDLLYVD